MKDLIPNGVWPTMLTPYTKDNEVQAPCNVHYAKGYLYMVMERFCHNDVKGWPVSVIAPVLMRAKVDADLTKIENWTFASEMCFRDTVNSEELDYFGIPFYHTPPRESVIVAP